MTKQSINQHKARAEAIGDDALTKVTNTCPDFGYATEPGESRSVLAVTG